MPGDGEQPLRMRIGQRAQEYGVHHAEDGRIGADAQGQRGHGRGGKGGTFAQHTRGVAQVAAEFVGPAQPYRFTAFFRRRGGAAEFDASLAARLARIHPGRHQVGGVTLHMAVHLGSHFAG
jgi:hypothetical protein